MVCLPSARAASMLEGPGADRFEQYAFADSTNTFTATTSGRLILYVNDVVLPAAPFAPRVRRAPTRAIPGERHGHRDQDGWPRASTPLIVTSRTYQPLGPSAQARWDVPCNGGD